MTVKVLPITYRLPDQCPRIKRNRFFASRRTKSEAGLTSRWFQMQDTGRQWTDLGWGQGYYWLRCARDDVRRDYLQFSIVLRHRLKIQIERSRHFKDLARSKIRLTNNNLPVKRKHGRRPYYGTICRQKNIYNNIGNNKCMNKYINWATAMD
jgi:hypothetical protein